MGDTGSDKLDGLYDRIIGENPDVGSLDVVDQYHLGILNYYSNHKVVKNDEVNYKMIVIGNLF